MVVKKMQLHVKKKGVTLFVDNGGLTYFPIFEQTFSGLEKHFLVGSSLSID